MNTDGPPVDSPATSSQDLMRPSMGEWRFDVYWRDDERSEWMLYGDSRFLEQKHVDAALAHFIVQGKQVKVVPASTADEQRYYEATARMEAELRKSADYAARAIKAYVSSRRDSAELRRALRSLRTVLDAFPADLRR